jgi:putative DNA primase/helicase
VAVPVFREGRADGWSDFNDLHQAKGLAAVKEAIEAALGAENAKAATNEETPPPESEGACISRLAGLSAVEYERIRAEEAKRLGMRASVLDKIVAKERKDAQAEGIGFDDVKPWPRPVAGEELLSDIAATIARFIVCKPETTHAAALWVAMSWLIDTVETAALAVITAPEKRCGKSQLLTVLGKLSRRPMVASNISPAALFRVIDAWQPTLMIDEADAFMRDNEELRGIINSGHKRDSAYVVRTVGEDFTPKQFSTWGAKAIAGIGHLADTLMDRAIILDLRRKLPHETVERLRYAEPGLFNTLAAKLARWTEDNREAVRRARPVLPAQLNDRAQDNWEPLLAIADVAGGIWPEQARRAALAISTGSEGDDLTIGAELLADIREVFGAKRIEHIGTAELIEALCADDEKPWATYNRGKPVTPRQIGKRLKEYDITSKNIRIGYGIIKGFEKSQFQDAFMRYLSPSDFCRYAATFSKKPSNEADSSVADSQNASATKSPISATPLHSGVAEKCSGVADKIECSGMPNASATLKPAPLLNCSGVADKKGGVEDEERALEEALAEALDERGFSNSTAD